MDTETMALRAEAALREQQNLLAKEDLSDMVAEHAAKQHGSYIAPGEDTRVNCEPEVEFLGPNGRFVRRADIDLMNSE